MDSNKKKLVEDRIQLVKQLNEAKSNFTGPDLSQRINHNTTTHLYKHYQGLRFYLLLTCFDILGQTEGWYSFNEWLYTNKSEPAKQERDLISKNAPSSGALKITKHMHSEYNKIYGARTSFNKFIDNVISEENRLKLFSSVTAIIGERGDKVGGLFLSGTEKDYDLSYKQKKDFLYSLRCDFTHEGISYGNPTGGFLPHFDLEGQHSLSSNESGTSPYISIEIYRKEIKEEIISFRVTRWPYVLIEIIESTIS